MECEVLVEELLAVLDELREPDADPELEALKAAILLEDVFGIVLTDDEIDPKLLRDHVAVLSLVRSGDGDA